MGARIKSSSQKCLPISKGQILGIYQICRQIQVKMSIFLDLVQLIKAEVAKEEILKIISKMTV